MPIDLGIYHRRLHKLAYYTRHSPFGLLPHRLLAKSIEPVLAEFARLPSETQQQIRQRVDYCNRQNQPFTLSGSLTCIVGQTIKATTTTSPPSCATSRQKPASPTNSAMSPTFPPSPLS